MKKIKYIILPLLMISILGMGSTVAFAKQGNGDDKHERGMFSMKMAENMKAKLMIEANGNGNAVLIKKGEVTGITLGAQNIIKVKIFGQEYKVLVGADTKLIANGKSNPVLSDFAVGQVVSVNGKLDATDSTLVHARVVHNLSLKKNNRAFFGTIKSIVAPDTIQLDAGARGLITVVTGPDTKIFEGGTLKAFSDLKIDAKVVVKGWFDTTLNKLQALTIKINPFGL